MTARPLPWPRLLRQIHLWLGVFFAPSILFFAITGGIQELKFHEAHTGYKPPPLVEKLGQVHIHQKFELKPVRKPKPDAKPVGAPKSEAPKADPTPPVSVTALRLFFTLTAIGLVATTVLGLWIGVVQSRQRLVPLLLLAAGAVIPVILLNL